MAVQPTTPGSHQNPHESSVPFTSESDAVSFPGEKSESLRKQTPRRRKPRARWHEKFTVTAQLLVSLVSLAAFVWSVLQFRSTQEATRSTKSAETLLKAIELLGSTTRSSRASAVLVLDQMSKRGEITNDQAIPIISSFLRDQCSIQASSPVLAQPRTLPVDVDVALRSLSEMSSRVKRLKGDEEPFVNLTGIDLSGVDLTTYGTITGWRLDSANLAKVKLANMTNCSLANANLTDALLKDITLSHVSLTSAILQNAFLFGVQLPKTTVRQTDFSTISRPWQVDWEEAVGDSSTKLPPTVKRPPLW